MQSLQVTGHNPIVGLEYDSVTYSRETGIISMSYNLVLDDGTKVARFINQEASEALVTNRNPLLDGLVLQHFGASTTE